MRYLIVWFIIFIVSFSCSRQNLQEEFSIGEVLFEEGDLIFRKGLGFRTQAVLYSDSLGIYSHTGIVVLKDSVFQVVHITPGERKNNEIVDMIKIEPISDFWNKDKASHGAVYRLKNNIWGKEAAKQALRLLKKEVLFDHHYLLSDTTEMYCTELVCYSYELAGKDITFGKRSELNVPIYAGTYILPSNIYTNSDFILVYKF